MGNLGYERVRIVQKLFFLAKLQKRYIKSTLQGNADV